MNKKHELLIQKLQSSSHPIPSSQLAKELQVTQRSVKNYVSAVNAETPELILSGPKGYHLNKKVKVSVSSHRVPQNYQERSFSIIKKFFLEHTEQIDIFELCDEFFLGYSSIKLLISKMNKELAPYRLALRFQNDCIYLQGTEGDKRKFLTNIIYRESAGGFVNLTALKALFPDLDIEYIHFMLHDTFKHYEYYIHDFAYANISLHLIVILYQTINHQFLGAAEADCELMDISLAVIENLESHFQICFHTQERQEINKLIYENLCLARADSEQELIQIVGQQLYQTTIEMIEKLNRHYGLHLERNALLYPLSLHLKNLLARYQNGSYLKNPLLDSIQKSCPLLFECGLYIAQHLNEEYRMKISEDETAYLAMHIGADIERQNANNKKLKCILLCPDYYNSQNDIYQYLLANFDSQIHIVSVCSREEHIPAEDFDLLFTTVETAHSYPHTVLIPPFKNAVNLKTVFNQIQEKMDQKKLKILSEHFTRFFQPELFYLQTEEAEDKEALIYRLYQLLKDKRFVNHYFYENVLKREKAATTAFGPVAIPHSMKMNANRTGIAIAVLPSGAAWDSQLVHVVLLVAINEHDTILFKELYEALILLFSQQDVIRRICACHSFEEFQQLILSYAE